MLRVDMEVADMMIAKTIARRCTSANVRQKRRTVELLPSDWQSESGGNLSLRALRITKSQTLRLYGFSY